MFQTREQYPHMSCAHTETASSTSMGNNGLEAEYTDSSRNGDTIFSAVIKPLPSSIGFSSPPKSVISSNRAPQDWLSSQDIVAVRIKRKTEEQERSRYFHENLPRIADCIPLSESPLALTDYYGSSSSELMIASPSTSSTIFTKPNQERNARNFPEKIDSYPQYYDSSMGATSFASVLARQVYTLGFSNEKKFENRCETSFFQSQPQSRPHSHSLSVYLESLKDIDQRKKSKSSHKQDTTKLPCPSQHVYCESCESQQHQTNFISKISQERPSCSHPNGEKALLNYRPRSVSDSVRSFTKERSFAGQLQVTTQLTRSQYVNKERHFVAPESLLVGDRNVSFFALPVESANGEKKLCNNEEVEKKKLPPKTSRCFPSVSNIPNIPLDTNPCDSRLISKTCSLSQNRNQSPGITQFDRSPESNVAEHYGLGDFDPFFRPETQSDQSVSYAPSNRGLNVSYGQHYQTAFAISVGISAADYSTRSDPSLISQPSSHSIKSSSKDITVQGNSNSTSKKDCRSPRKISNSISVTDFRQKSCSPPLLQHSTSIESPQLPTSLSFEESKIPNLSSCNNLVRTNDQAASVSPSEIDTISMVPHNCTEFRCFSHRLTLRSIVRIFVSASKIIANFIAFICMVCVLLILSAESHLQGTMGRIPETAPVKLDLEGLSTVRTNLNHALHYHTSIAALDGAFLITFLAVLLGVTELSCLAQSALRVIYNATSNYLQIKSFETEVKTKSNEDIHVSTTIPSKEQDMSFGFLTDCFSGNLFRLVDSQKASCLVSMLDFFGGLLSLIAFLILRNAISDSSSVDVPSFAVASIPSTHYNSIMSYTNNPQEANHIVDINRFQMLPLTTDIPAPFPIMKDIILNWENLDIEETPQIAFSSPFLPSNEQVKRPEELPLLFALKTDIKISSENTPNSIFDGVVLVSAVLSCLSLIIRVLGAILDCCFELFLTEI